MTVSLNIDLGELPGEPAELYSLADLANVACGGHAGDAATMRLACVRARVSGTQVGAHPSYPDRPRFGRVSMPLPMGELRSILRAQCAALRDVAHATGVIVRHVKPHGALYHDANADPSIARAILEEAVGVFGTISVIGPAIGALSDAARDLGLPYLREGFADRALAADGTLVPRTEPGAVLTDPDRAATQARRLAATGLYDTLCVHSDTPHAVELAQAVRAAL